MKSWKVPTWEELRKVCDSARVDWYLDSVPKSVRGEIALALSVAKWSPERGKNRGNDTCGLCALYHYQCSNCPLGREYIPCTISSSLWYRATSQGRNRKKYMDALYNALVKLYKRAYDAWFN